MILFNQVASPKRKKWYEYQADCKDYKENPVQVCSPYLI